MIPEFQTVLWVIGAFLAAGIVKGVVGLGLPTVAVGILTAVVGLRPALAIVALPIILTNAWQSVDGPDLRVLARRLLPFIAPLILLSFVGALFLARADSDVIEIFFGSVMVLYSAISLAGFQVSPPGDRERWMSPVFGTISGVLNGLTGMYMVPGLLYLQALGMPRDMMIQALGLVLMSGGLALAVALGGNQLFTWELAILSVIAVPPCFLGMAMGKRIRQRLSEKAFRRAFFVGVLLLGLYIVARHLV